MKQNRIVPVDVHWKISRLFYVFKKDSPHFPLKFLKFKENYGVQLGKLCATCDIASLTTNVIIWSLNSETSPDISSQWLIVLRITSRKT